MKKTIKSALPLGCFLCIAGWVYIMGNGREKINSEIQLPQRHLMAKGEKEHRKLLQSFKLWLNIWYWMWTYTTNLLWMVQILVRCVNWISELIFSLPFPIMYTQPAIQRKQSKGSALFIVFSCLTLFQAILMINCVEIVLCWIWNCFSGNNWVIVAGSI